MAVTDLESISDLQYARAFGDITCTAGAASNANAITAVIVLDRANYKYARSAALCVPYIAALTSGKKFSLNDVYIEHGDNSVLSDASNYIVFSNADVAVDGTTANNGCKMYTVHLGGAKRYLRVKCTPVLSNGATDVANFTGMFVFGFGYTT